MKPDFFDLNGEPRHYNIWYPLPFVIDTCVGKLSSLPVELGRMQFVRRKLADGTIDCWPAFGRPAAEPIAWMFSRDGFYEI